jgi:hydroxyethylthiazole kinase
VTGAIDIISDGTRSFAVRNGHPAMARITGSGCMLSAIVGAFVGAAKQAGRAENLTDAAVAAVAARASRGSGPRPTSTLSPRSVYRRAPAHSARASSTDSL